MLFGTRQIPKLVSARVFEHNGRQVEERIYKWTETHNKLIWAIYPVDRVVLEDGETCNPVCHKDYVPAIALQEGLPPDNIMEEKARQAVQKAFDGYWDGPKGKQFKFTSKRKVKQEIAEEVSDRIENDKIVDLEETNG